MKSDIRDFQASDALMTSTLTAYLTHMQPKVKVPSTQDKPYVSWVASQSYAATASAL